MTPRNNQSYSILIRYTLGMLVLVILYFIITMFIKRRTTCGCGRSCGCGCMGGNVYCPCNRTRLNKRRTEYYQPQFGSDFTSYLNQVRENQLQFSKN